MSRKKKIPAYVKRMSTPSSGTLEIDESLWGNVALASHGETATETLGKGEKPPKTKKPKRKK